RSPRNGTSPGARHDVISFIGTFAEELTMRTPWVIYSVVLGIAAALSPVVRAADGEADLRWKFEKDKPFYEEITTQTKSTMKVMGTDLTQAMRLSFYWSWTPRELDAKKNWTIRLRLVGVQMESDIGGIKVEFD